MVTHLHRVFSPEFNSILERELQRRAEWRLGLDEYYHTGLDTDISSDTGFVYYTYTNDHDWHQVAAQDPNRGYFNTLAETILDTVLAHTDQARGDIHRVMWNYYNRSSTGVEHQDAQQDDLYTLIYNPSNTDGGTYIDNEFYPGEQGSAILFPSNTRHRGESPRTSPRRFCLNVIFQKTR